MRGHNRRTMMGFTLVEILIVVVVMAILAGMVFPQFGSATNDAKVSSARFNLQVLRSQIDLYKYQHTSLLPSQTLAELLISTNASGLSGSGQSYPYGPYMAAIPENPFTHSNTVVATPNPPTGTVLGAGWLYDGTSGRIWLNDTSIPFESQ